MAESGAAGALGVVRGGRGGQGAAAAVARAGPAATLAQRPPLILPPRSSFESLFRGVVAEASPGPLTLVSSFFSEEADHECRSFTQLLVGAMNSPVAAARRGVGPAMEQQQTKGDGRDDLGSSGMNDSVTGGRLARLEQNRPSSLAITQPQLFAVPPGLSPASLLDSPAFFSSPLSGFRISHQEALAQVTAQAAQSPFRKLGQAESPSSFFSAAATSLVQEPIQDIPTLQSNNTTPESAEDSQSDQISQPAAVVGKPAEDGYNWRKYGQKVVKGSEYPRSYYKCTHPNCTVKKKIEHSVDGQITEIIYKGQHSHQKPPQNKRAREGGNLPRESYNTNGKLDHTITGEQGLQCLRGAPNETDDISSCAIIPQRDQDPGTSEQFSGSSERKEVAETKVDAMDELEPDHKRRTISISSEKATTEPRIIVQTRSEVDLLDDGYRWRKYGQKVVKGNPNPRSYYKCTYGGCNVRKHVERSSTDLKDVITTYEGKHNHDMPAARNSSHNKVNAPASSGM